MSPRSWKSKPEAADFLFVSHETSAPPGFQEAQAMFDRHGLVSQFGVSKRGVADTAGFSVSATCRKSGATPPSAVSLFGHSINISKAFYRKDIAFRPAQDGRDGVYDAYLRHRKINCVDFADEKP